MACPDYPYYQVTGTDGFGGVSVQIFISGDASVDPQDIVDAVEAAVDGSAGISLTGSTKYEITPTSI